METTGLSPAEAKRRDKALKVQTLALEGLTQAEIGKRVGMSQRGVGLLLKRLAPGRAPKRAITAAQAQARAATAAAVLGVPVAEPVREVRRRAPGGGRKPSGADGAKVSDYPAVMFRLPAATVASLKALALVRGVPMWRLVDEAVSGYVGAVRGDEAEDMRRLAKRQLERLEAKR
jgi:hypothetical protein